MRLLKFLLNLHSKILKDLVFLLLTVGSYSDEGSDGEEQHKDHITAEQEPSQRGQVVEPGSCVGVQSFMEECLKVSLASKSSNCP